MAYARAKSAFTYTYTEPPTLTPIFMYAVMLGKCLVPFFKINAVHKTRSETQVFLIASDFFFLLSFCVFFLCCFFPARCNTYNPSLS